MKFGRQAAVIAPALFLLFLMLISAPAAAQRTPQAAPTGEPAQTQNLGAPAAVPLGVDVDGLAVRPFGQIFGDHPIHEVLDRTGSRTGSVGLKRLAPCRPRTYLARATRPRQNPAILR